MVEDVDLVPADKIEPRAVWQKIETGLGQFGAPFAGQHGIKNSIDFMQEQEVRSGLGLLLGR